MIIWLILLWIVVDFLPAYLVTKHASHNAADGVAVWAFICLVFPIFGFLLYLTYWQGARFNQV
ncbi:hypothetical protein [Sulfobacillus harzensis]|uniref:Uncharacterized protein n=1 Tax=Sulfobacillus harzensis TaxID=2729629 RepID=A0A7Y0Q255_9FIRM|nr:hypothetical protein [Sulfobacillus harzensis]NMP22127.1 hypothetical protein [Sulfobacillus harzensis]